MHSDNRQTTAEWLSGLITLQGTPNRVVLTIMLVSACLVTTARVLAPFQVGKDQASQLEAAENLVAGRGLTTTAVPSQSFDISVDPEPRYLTWWPPGFSLVVAVFLKAGLSLQVSLKIVYLFVTLIGWIGWAVVISHFLTRPLTLGQRKYPLHFIIAAALPLFFTLGWDGTDILLWAGIPFLLVLLFKQRESNAGLLSVVVAGLLFGALYAIRYASLFLALFALLMLFQVRFPDYRSALKRYALFLLSGLTIVLPTYLYSRLYAVGIGGIADRATIARLTSSPSTVLKGILRNLPITSNMLFGIPLPDQILYQINSTLLLYVAGLTCLLILLLLPLVLKVSWNRAGKKFQDDLALSVWFLPFSLLAFLIGVNFAVRLGLVGIRRYYDPLVLCGILIFYQLATTRLTHRGVAYLSRAVVLSFVAYACLYMPALGFIPERNGHLVKTVLGFVPANNAKYRGTSHDLSYPSSQVFSNKEGVRQRLRLLAADYPDALFFVEEYAYFAYDGSLPGGPLPGKTMRVLSRPEYWARAFTSQPVRVFWVVNENTELNFLHEQDQELLFLDHVEKTKVVVTEFPAGYRFFENQLVQTDRHQESPSPLK